LSPGNFGGGGGGAGYFGGGGGGSNGNGAGNSGGGGGGSSFGPTGSVFATAATGPSVTISYTQPGPTSKADCKNGGWRDFGDMFKNQGQCVTLFDTD
jgi:hypothetical protein